MAAVDRRGGPGAGLWSRLVETCSDAVVIADADRVVQDWNQTAGRLLGLRDDDRGRPLHDVLRPESDDGEAATLRLLADGDRSAAASGLSLRNRHGSNLVVDARVLRDAHRVVVVLTDRTERTEAQQLLAQLHERHRRMEQLATIGAWQLHPPTGAMQLSEQVFEIVGIDPLAATGTLDELLDLVTDDEDRERLRAALTEPHGAAVTPVDVSVTRPDGQRRWLRFLPDREPDDRDQTSGTVQDITQLRRALDRANRSNAELERFASAVAHDLRTPLSVIATGASLLRESSTGADTAAIVAERIQANAEAASEQVVTLLDEARRRTAAPDQVDLGEVVRWVRSVLREPVEEADATLRAPDALPVVAGRLGLVRQCLLNLVANALTHGRPGGVVEISAPDPDQDDQVLVVVADDGPGIPEDRREEIFDAGVRLADEDVPGTGLGLSSVREAMTTMHGSVHVEDAELGGAAFVLRFQAPEVADAD